MKTLLPLFLMLPFFGFNQTAITSFSISNINPTAVNNINSTGWNASGAYPNSTTYSNRYGQRSTGFGNERHVQGFTLGAFSYSPITSTGNLPYDVIAINRHPSLPGNIIHTQFETTVTTDVSPIYYEAAHVNTLEALLNSFVCNRGTDNTFANVATTSSNLERIDLIKTAGIFCKYPNSQGFLINESGGNDNFKVAVITGINGSNIVTALGTLTSVTSATWGAVGPAIVTKVMSRNIGVDANLRPKQDGGAAQTIAGTFITLGNLGISNGTTIYGIAIFPNDVTAAMNLITLTDVPSNTTSASTTGGLDLYGGGGYFVENTILPVHNLQFNGFIKDGHVSLQWSTDKEIDNDHFEIQRSIDGQNWSAIGVVPAGPSNGASYEYKDLLVQSSVIYYRLKQVDKNGRSLYSKIIQVRVEKKNAVKVFPNPATGEINIVLPNDWLPGKYQVKLKNMIGQILFEQEIHSSASNNRFTITPSQQKPGVYLVGIYKHGNLLQNQKIQMNF